jgi:hypothetical protein
MGVHDHCDQSAVVKKGPEMFGRRAKDNGKTEKEWVAQGGLPEAMASGD